jgi:hypothetical protein
MSEVEHLYRLCEIFLEGQEKGELDRLIAFVDDFVSSDKVYDFEDHLQRAVLSLQDTLAIFDAENPDVPRTGFASLKQVSGAVYSFLSGAR